MAELIGASNAPESLGAHPNKPGAFARKVPVIMQMEALECGAACLAMICAHYGKWLGLSQVREDCGVGRDGVNVSNISKVAKAYGFDARGYRFNFDSLKTKATFPCIIHWDFEHFVVLRGFKRRKVYINDPAQGEVVMSEDEARKHFTGVCLCLAPGEGFLPEGSRPNPLREALSQLAPMRTKIVFISVCVLVLAAIAVANAYASQVFLDSLGVVRQSQLAGLVLILLALAVVSTAAQATQARVERLLEGELAVRANEGFMHRLLRLPMNFFSQRSAGDLSNRMELNESIAAQFVVNVVPLAANVIMALCLLVVMATYSPLLAALSLAVTALNLFVQNRVAKSRANLARVSAAKLSMRSAVSVCGLQEIEVIKSSGSESGFFDTWASAQASFCEAQAKIVGIAQRIGVLPSIISSLANVVVLCAGAFLALKGSFTAGMVLAFNGIFLQFFSPAQTIIDSMTKIEEVYSNVERVQDVMTHDLDVAFSPTAEQACDAPLERLKGDIEFKDVTFGYARSSKPQIEHVSFTVPAGSSVAIVGGSGCGKSTIAKILAGLHRPWSGEVLVDGKPIDSIPMAARHVCISMVDQQISLFGGTIMDNLTMWNRVIDEADVIEAVRDACIYDDIIMMPGAFQATVDEDGSNLSGGQRQRLEIARALVNDPSILIMDEATSALDGVTEKRVLQAIEARGITRVIVAHRLSTIRNADLIVVLDKGVIVERGTHDELVAKNGLYNRLLSEGE